MKTLGTAEALRRVSATSMYFVILLIWLITVGSYLPDLLELPFFSETTSGIPEPAMSESPIPPTTAGVIVAALGALLLVAVVVYIFKTIYAPAVERSAEKVTQTAQRQILTTLKKHEPHMPVKKQRKVQKWTTTAVHLAGILIPVTVAFTILPISDDTFRLVVQFAITSLGLFAALLFVASRRFSRA